MQIFIITAFDSNQLIGKNNTLPWNLPEDLAYFKRTTANHPIVMGRATFESIGKKLPNRRNIIISRTLNDPDCISSPEALWDLNLQGPVFIIGGASIYQKFLPHASALFITHIEKVFDGDCFFPQINWESWQLESEAIKEADEIIDFQRRYSIYRRK